MSIQPIPYDKCQADVMMEYSRAIDMVREEIFRSFGIPKALFEEEELIEDVCSSFLGSLKS